jgi:hypothetical protein
MAWTNIPFNKITFGLFTGSTPGATVNVAAADLLLCRFKLVGLDTLVVDVRVKKAFFTPNTAAVTGITMELDIPFNSIFLPALGAPSSFMDGGQTYSNDCDICLDPGSFSYVAGVIAVLNEQNRKIVLLVRNLAGLNLNPTPPGVVGFFGQMTFEVTPKPRLGKTVASTRKTARAARTATRGRRRG